MIDINSIERQPAVCLGPYGCGTNFLIKSLEKSGAFITNGMALKPVNNAQIPVFKHYIIEQNSLKILCPPENYHFICIYKHPLYWFKSLQRMVHDHIMPAIDMRRMGDLSLSEFIRRPGRMVCVEREIKDEEKFPDKREYVNYENLPDLWNKYARGYLDYLPVNTIRLAYEKLILQPDKFVKEIIYTLNGSCEHIVIDKSRRFENDRADGIGRNFDESLAYYNDIKNRYEGYSQDDLKYIRKIINEDAMFSLGYHEI